MSEQQSSADSAHAKIANWLEDQARIATNGLHCGDNSTVIKHTYDWADKLEAAARHLRAEPRASADSAEPVAWIVERVGDPTFPRFIRTKADADRIVAYVNCAPPATAHPLFRTEPQTAPSDIERAFQDACDEAGCAYDNEALLEAIHALKERCQAVIAPQPTRWRHKKRGTTYTFVGVCEVQAEEPLTDYEVAVVYRSEQDGRLWVRRKSEFNDGRFEALPSSALTRPQCEGK
jgi:hypothetical protein